MHSIASVMGWVAGRPWAVIPGTFQHYRSIGESAVAPVEFQAAARTPRMDGGVAVIPVRGLLTQREQGGLFGLMFGAGSTYEGIAAQISEADSRQDVGRILLDIDSPGGEVYGLEPLVQTMQARMGTKPLTAVANAVAGSAAYHIASQADELVVAPGGQVGSIGVIGVHIDDSKMMEAEGIVETIIGMPEGKVDEWASELTDATRKHHEGQLAEHYRRFVANVAKGRGTTPAKVAANFGGGRMLMDVDAKAAGMVDRIASMPDTLARLIGGKPTGRGRPRAEAAKLRMETGIWD